MHLLRVFLVAAAWLCTGPAQAQEFWGAQLPDFGPATRVTGLYRGADGAIVMGFIAGPRNARFVDYYDTSRKKRLAPERAYDVARNNDVQNQVLANLRLTPIESQGSSMTNSAGTTFEAKDVSGGRCEWPYDAVLTIGNARDYLVARKLPKPETRSYGCGYRDSGAQRRVRTRYQAEEPDVHWTAGPDVYAVFGDRTLVRFDARGNTHFFDGRTDIVMLRAEKIAELLEPLLSWAEDGVASTRRAQAYVSQAEAIIDGAAKRN